MANDSLKDQLKELTDKYDNMDVLSAQYDEERGQSEIKIAVRGGPEMPNELPEGVNLLRAESAADLIPDEPASTLYHTRAARSLLELDPLHRGDLDLLKPSVLRDEPQAVFQRSIDYYRTKPIYGSTINVLTNFASKGFENDIDDENIKIFFDCWKVDTGFDDIVEKIFFDFFRIGMVRTYKVLGRYEPKINFLTSLPGSASRQTNAKYEQALRGNRFTNAHLPIGYTILNPTQVVIKGSLMFGQTATFLKKAAGKEIKELLKMKKSDLSTFQRKILDSLPSDFKAAVSKDEDIPLDPDLIGEVDYRRMPYERYPLPRSSRAFESVEFHDELRKADYSTLDGITNYILLIRIGNDNNPVKKQETLDRASELFDTVSKSYKIVWNHTMDIQKITSPEIGDILGPDKYRQVNGDITGGLGMVRALIDGTGEGNNRAATELAVKSVIEEINYARRQVIRWIYGEYRQVAEVMGFDRIPKVRFDDMALRDEIQMMSMVQGMIDRRIISYHTGQKKLGYDPDFELSQMEKEKPLVQEGILGIVGSPFQQSRSGGDNVQREQRTPKGTPSEGRPRGRPARSPQNQPDGDDSSNQSSASLEDITNVLAGLSVEELEKLIELKKLETSPEEKSVSKTTKKKPRKRRRTSKKE